MLPQNNSFINCFQISKLLPYKSNQKIRNVKNSKRVLSKYLSPNNNSNFIAFTDNSRVKKNDNILESRTKKYAMSFIDNNYQISNPYNTENRNLLYMEKQKKSDKKTIHDLHTEINKLKEKIKKITDENLTLLNDKKNLNIKVMSLQKDKQLLIEQLTDFDKVLNNKIKIKLNQNEDNLTGLQNQIYELKSMNDNLKIQNNIQQNIINELKKQIIQNNIKINENKIYENEKDLINQNKSLVSNENIIQENSLNNLKINNDDIFTSIKKKNVTCINIKKPGKIAKNFTQHFLKNEIIEDDELYNSISLKKNNLFSNIKNPSIKRSKKEKYLKCKSFVNISNSVDDRNNFTDNFNYNNCGEIILNHDNNKNRKSLNNLNIIKNDKKRNEKINFNNYMNKLEVKKK